jgi:DNA-binding protein YbaB
MMSAEFDQLVAEFEQFQARIHSADERFADLAGMQDELSAMEVSASSPDRAVTVVAGPGGSVKDIRLTEAAMQYGPQRLAGTLMSTLQEAMAESARKQALIVQEHVGGDEPILDQVLETQAEVTGMSVEELREKVEGEPRRTPRTDDPEAEESLVFRDTPPPPPATPAPPASDADNFLRNLTEED